MLHLRDVYLTDDAEVWSRSIADSWLDMNDLEFADLRLQYSIPDLQIRLEDDIRNRTQAPEEAISQYIPKIRILLDKLSPRLPMQSQLDRVYRNLHPDYQRAFKRKDFTSFQELQKLGTAEETRRDREKRYTEPSDPDSFLFPETGHYRKGYWAKHNAALQSSDQTSQNQSELAATTTPPPPAKP